MKGSWNRSILVGALVISSVALTAAPVLAAGKQKLTGEVGDAMCGKNHMEGTAAECTRACVTHGSKYALIVGDKVYTLNTSDKTVQAVLNLQAGQKATVYGTVDGDKIDVESAVAAR